MNDLKKHVLTISTAVALAAFGGLAVWSSTSHAESSAETPRLVGAGSAKAYALALPPVKLAL